MRVELFAGGNGGGMRALLGTDVQKVVAHPSEPLFPQFGDLLLNLKQITDEISAQMERQNFSVWFIASIVMILHHASASQGRTADIYLGRRITQN